MSTCIEKKLTLSGKVYLFKCELLHLRNGFGALRYIIDKEYDVAGIKLRPGNVTLAFYWIDRPYTLYVWQLSGYGIIYYFNIADSISLRPGEFIWRDLVVDILVDADRNVRVLDENELPEDLSPDLSRYIQKAKSVILGEHEEIMREINAFMNKLLWPQNALQ